MLILVLKDSLRTFFKSLSLSWSLGVRSLSLSGSLGDRSLSLSWSLGVRPLLTSLEEWEKISRTKHNNKLRSASNDCRRKSPDTDTKKETKEMEPRKRQRIWNGQRLLFLQEFFLHFT